MEKVLKEHSEYGLHGEGLRHSIYVVERNKIELQFRTDPNADIARVCLEYCQELGTEKSICRIFRRSIGGGSLRSMMIRLFWCILWRRGSCRCLRIGFEGDREVVVWLKKRWYLEKIVEFRKISVENAENGKNSRKIGKNT